MSNARQQTATHANDVSAESASLDVSIVCRRTVSRGPLTFQQLFLWDYLHLEKGERQRDPFVFRIIGSLDRDLFANSLNEIVRRHDCLRTRIVMTDGILEQHVDEPVDLDLEVLDLVDLAQSDRDVRAERFVAEFAGRKCDLAAGPPMITALIRMSRDEHLLAWAIHHVIADGTTIGIVLGELWSVYGELVEGKQLRLARIPVRYLDYAIWQHATHRDWQQQHGTYWKERIAGAERVRWPTDADVANDEHATAWFEVVDVTPLAELRRVARSARTTPAMAMLTVYAAVVAGWCGQKVFTIPVNIAGRHRAEHESAAGYFAQFLCVAVEMTGGETFLELLARISGVFREALRHQDFGQIAARVPDVLLGSMFSWLPWNRDIGIPAPSISKEIGITVQPFPFTHPAIQRLEFSGIAPFFWETQGKYSAALWYSTEVFSTGTVERFAAELRSLCARVVTNPHCLAVDGRNC